RRRSRAREDVRIGGAGGAERSRARAAGAVVGGFGAPRGLWAAVGSALTRAGAVRLSARPAAARRLRDAAPARVTQQAPRRRRLPHSVPGRGGGGRGDRLPSRGCLPARPRRFGRGGPARARAGGAATRRRTRRLPRRPDRGAALLRTGGGARR